MDLDKTMEDAYHASAETANLAIVFTRPNCPWCDKVEALLKSKDYSVDKRNIYTFDEVVLKAFALQFKTVPQVVVDGRLVGGYEATEKYLEDKSTRAST
jgi:glutaredoxin